MGMSVWRARAAATGARPRGWATAAWGWVSARAAPDERVGAGTPAGAWRGEQVMLGVVALAASVFAVIVTAYSLGLHDTLQTPGEDLGIMDQVLWNTIHGHFMHQTICNPLTDSNCLGDVSRFAIHFEPILIALAPLYLIAPSVKALLALQAVAVALGAFPAALLAARRLGHPLWGVAAALAYLLHPGVVAAVIDGFHPETLAAPILMAALFCLAARRYRALAALCVLALLCKETMAIDVLAIGLYVALWHRRWRLGIGLAATAVAALALALLLMHALSPLGQSPVAGRLDTFERAPLATLALIVTDPARRAYVGTLLAPVGFLPLLSPWMLALAVPAALLNLVSDNPLMYSGIFQYNADIVPVLIAAAVDGLAWALPAVARAGWGRRLAARLWVWVAVGATRLGRVRRSALAPRVTSSVLLLFGIGFALPAAVSHDMRALSLGRWPVATPHTAAAEDSLRLIPAAASVSAEWMLVPHLSQRAHVYQFPAGVAVSEYIVLDVVSDNVYPFASPSAYHEAVRGLLRAPDLSVLSMRDGYLVLQRVDTTRADGATPAAERLCRRAPPEDTLAALLGWHGQS